MPGCTATLEREGPGCLVNEFGKTVITDLESVSGDEDVLRLKVTVDDFGMQDASGAHHDNSANNPNNPNPNVTVRWGDQTWEEMMIGWFGVVVDASVQPQNVIVRPQRRPAAE